ncbi:MAG TPA: hypothetical protein VKB28_09445 [Solirubrobacteraceae bacterium]|nr:hypothetical protein [Solirubrobacteraceae bacterium]
MCEPPSVGTPLTSTGFAGLETSKMRMPSKPGIPPAIAVELQSGLVRGVSTDTNSRSCQTDMSCCEPGQAKSTICSGFSGSEPSMI